MDIGMVYMKYIGPGGNMPRHSIMHKPLLFDPYEALTLDEYRQEKAYFDSLPDDFIIVSQAEYEADLAEKEAAAAAIFYCGDFGGVNKKGAFCGRRVDEPGNRCEHHGTATGNWGGGFERPADLGGGYFFGYQPAAEEEAQGEEQAPPESAEE